jgi:hypothetical protein
VGGKEGKSLFKTFVAEYPWTTFHGLNKEGVNEKRKEKKGALIPHKVS